MVFESDAYRRRNETWKRGWSCDFHGFDVRAPSSTLVRYWAGWGSPVLPAEQGFLCRANLFEDMVKLRTSTRVSTARPYALEALASADVDNTGIFRSESAVVFRTRAHAGDVRTELKLVELNLLSKALAPHVRGSGDPAPFRSVAGIGLNVLWRLSSAITLGVEGTALVRDVETLPVRLEPPTAVRPFLQASYEYDGARARARTLCAGRWR